MKNIKWPIFISTVLVASSLATYVWLGNYHQLRAVNNEPILAINRIQKSSQTIREGRIEALQAELYKDKQNSELWYQLGHAYLLNDEYKNAAIVFDYAIRLTTSKSSDHYASKAMALYYVNKQKMNEEIKTLVEKALEIDPHNQTALMMSANEQFMQARYQQAITLWVKILDSNQSGINRVAIIHRINQAKQFLK